MLDSPLAEVLRDPTALRDVAITHGLIADSLSYLGELDEAIVHIREASSGLQAIVDREPDHGTARRESTVMQRGLGELLAEIGETAEALEVVGQARSTLEELAKLDPENFLIQTDLGVLYTETGLILMRHGDHAAALIELEKARRLADNLPDEVRESTEVKAYVIKIHRLTGETLAVLGR